MPVGATEGIITKESIIPTRGSNRPPRSLGTQLEVLMSEMPLWECLLTVIIWLLVCAYLAGRVTESGQQV